MIFSGVGTAHPTKNHYLDTTTQKLKSDKLGAADVYRAIAHLLVFFTVKQILKSNPTQNKSNPISQVSYLENVWDALTAVVKAYEDLGRSLPVNLRVADTLNKPNSRQRPQNLQNPPENLGLRNNN
jgi:hypothetical protein